MKQTPISASIMLAGLLACGCSGEAGLEDDGGGSLRIDQRQSADTVDGNTGKTLGHLRSGDRLRMRIATTAGGARTFLGWHDSQRGEDCSFRRAEDGKLRCLPEGVMGANWTTEYFTDKDCTVPGVGARVSSTCATAGYVLVPLDRPCDAGKERFKVIVGTPVSGGGYAREQGRCGSHTSSGIYFFRVDKTVPASDFVEAVTSIE